MTMLGLDSPTEQIQWIVDGQPVPGQSGASLACADITRGSEVYAIAHVGGKGIASNKVTIKNTPPSLTEVALLPVEFKPGDNLLVQAGANDVDGDAVSIQYLWTRNGQPAGNTYKLAIPVKRGDSISIRITPFDGQDAGEPIILTREIRNFPPSFVEHKNVTIQDNVLIYQAQAIDPDGDPVTFSLESAGEGLSIQSATGTLAWKVPPDFKGERQVTIIAEDGHGGRVRYPVTLTIK
ncbi:MAG: Ig-like domain-containing protein [Nitrospirota bacterium]|nr:Ig-like domain-containing protein [Nitrospirota bacterium]